MRQPNQISPSLKFLVVEDDHEDFFLFCNRAKKLGLQEANLLNSRSVRETIEVLSQTKIDVVFLDLNVEDSTGIETFESIQKHFPALPIIVLSGNAEDQMANKAVGLGAQDYIAKHDIANTDLIKAANYAIERQRLVDRLRQNSEFKSHFLAQMSHEIRTPMNGVIGLTDILSKADNLTVDQKEIVASLAKCGKHLVNLISDILDVSKIEAGKLELEEHEFKLRELVEDSMTIFSQKAQEKGLTLINLVHPEVPAVTIGDRDRIGQILTNLIGNAVKFTDRGFISVEVESIEEENNRHVFSFRVQDTGCGIDESLRPRLFNEYQQAAFSATDSGIRGTGLGLAICRGIVQKLGGDIWVTSEKGGGSTFRFEVSMATRRTKNSCRTMMKGSNVTLISPSQQRRALLRSQLLLRGLGVHSEDIPKEAGDACLRNQNRRCHLVVLDAIGSTLEETRDHIAIARSRVGNSKLPFLVITQVASGWELGPHVARVSGSLLQAKIYYLIASLLGEQTHQGSPSRQTQENQKFDLTVLVADDNQVNRKVAERMLKILGCQTYSATDGKEAFEIVKANHVDLVLMDCKMPVMDGYDATRCIRGLLGRKGQTAVIALTANAFAEDREKCKAAGMDGFLSKPIVIDQLREQIAQVLTDRNPERLNTEPTLKPRTQEGEADGGILERLSLETLKSLESENDSFLDELIETFSNQAPDIIASMGEAVEKKDSRGLEHFAHKLKGFSRNLGAARLTKVCNEVELNAEDYAKRGDAKVLARIELEFRNAKDLLMKDWHT